MHPRGGARGTPDHYGATKQRRAQWAGDPAAKPPDPPSDPALAVSQSLDVRQMVPAVPGVSPDRHCQFGRP